MAYLIFRYAVFHGTCFRDRFGIAPVPTQNNIKVVSSQSNIVRIESFIREGNAALSNSFTNNEYVDMVNDFNRKNGAGSDHKLNMFMSVCNLNHE
jgi:hypothetical protein